MDSLPWDTVCQTCFLACPCVLQLQRSKIRFPNPISFFVNLLVEALGSEESPIAGYQIDAMTSDEYGCLSGCFDSIEESKKHGVTLLHMQRLEFT